MIKFIKNNSRKLYIIGSAILVLMIAVLGVMIAGEFGKNVSAANTHTVTVAKTSTVTVYVSGKGVTYDPSLSTDNTEVYHVEEDTSITLRAVNESRVFTSWKITGGYDKVDNAAVLTDKLFEITPTADITIDTEKKNALLADYGEYMNASFMITLDTHLMYLQKIFEAGSVLANVANKDVLDAYDYFFEKYSTYETNILPISNTTQAEAKATAIINNGLFTKIQNGYYKIGSSFSLLDENFKGIGNETYPFKGIFCGNSNSTKATIFVTASGTETSGDMHRGLFQITDPEAVIRNVNIRVSLGVKANASTAATNIYAGGVAGKVNKSVISNVDVLARIAVDATSANIYAGGVAGELAGGLDDSRNVLINGNDSTFILTTYASEKSIYSGLVSGNATNVYVKEANIDATSFAISAKNTASNTYNANTNVYLGNLFGKYTATSAMPIENVKISGSSKESITSLISSGNSYIGGLIGHLTVSSGSVNLGDVSIKNTSGESKLSASSVDKNSQTNLLTAGLIACVVGNNLNAKEEFLDGVKTKVVDGVTHYEYEYIFNTDLLIQSVNNGQGNGSTFGKTMATGFIARGYMNLNGNSDTDRNEIFLSSGKYKTKIYATQTSTSSHLNPETGANDKEHCVATAFYGNINKTSGTIQYINIYASNFDIAATRELGSKGKGDVMAAGFLSYTQGVTISDCTLYLDESSIKGHSLSYEVTNSTANANNTFVGGFIGQFEGLNYYTPLTLKNIKFAGNYDHKTNVVSGSSTIIEGIQNTIGGGDDQNCNFIGGIVGWLQHANANGLYFEGSNSDRDYIASLTHENPASAFCGGVIGYIRTRDGKVITIENIEISKTKVYSGATVINANGIPDIYVGGILGSAFCAGGTVGVNIDSTRVIDVDIIGEGNENIQLTVGGIVGSTTWDGKVTINNSYVIRSNISSSLAFNLTYSSTNLCSHAAGIIGRSNTNADINNCAVIDSVINSEFKNNSGYSIYCDTSSSLIYGNSENALTGAGGAETVKISNCYSNSSVKSTSNMYTIVRNYSDSAGSVSVSNSYYVKQNVETATGLGTALDFSTKEVFDTYTRLFTNLSQDSASKYYIDIDKTSLFEAGTNNTSIGVKALVSNSSSFADIWINAKASGDTSKNPSNYATETELIEAGWFKLGSLVVFNGNPSATSTKTDTNYSYVLNGGEYVYQTDGEHAGKYKNNKYPYDVIDKVNYELVTDGSNKVTLGTTQVTLESTINVNVVPDMHQIKMTFNLDPSNYYPVLYNKNGTLIQTSGLSYDEYGKFDFVISGNTYEITFSPNELIEHDDEFYIGFVNRSGSLLTSSCHKFVINHNKKILVGLIYADYTKPINYQDITYADGNDDGIMDVVYKLRAGTITKILPVFVMSNDPTKYIISELEVSSVKYSANSGTIKSNGEFQSPSSGNGTITVTYTANGTTTTKKISFAIVDEISVSYSSIGADVEALTYATSENDYYLDLKLLDHYGGNPSIFTLDITTTNNDIIIYKNDIINNGWIYAKGSTTPLTSWNIENTEYTLKIPKSYLKNNGINSIEMDIEFPVVYTISFDLQSDSFNPEYTGDTEFNFRVEAGTTFGTLFGTPNAPTANLQKLLDALKPELQGGVKKFGFVFGGFYLIDNGNSLDAYSMSFEELLEKQGGLEIYSSYNFFGRWSFLIEHIEAPGTEIKTSFESGFMENIGLTEEEREELELNDSITIPINNNRGYVFTVEKEEGFIGEAQVNAYIVANENHIDKNGDGKCDICNNPAEEIKSDHIREITIEKYHDNMYLYFIPAEEITGYLVIVSNVTNSSIIVGKNTASVTEQILPEDGIYTFKYVVNHKDGESYIYDSTANLLNIKRNIMIEFFTQVYDEDAKATDVEERKLPVGTVIEVYYSLYEDGVLTNQTIGVYKTTSADESKVYLDQFKKWNQAEDAFSNITFATLLSNNTSTSEVYYFVVTPPNGTDTRRSTSGNEIINEVIYVGYCNEAKTDYISGMRNDDDIINQPIEDIVEGVATKESSKNEKIYSVTPSRVTNLTKTDNNNYTFTDITTYHVIDLDISNGSINDGKIVLSDDATNNTIITSSSIKGKIREIGLELGFGTGLVEVLGSTDGLSWTPIATFLVDDVDYKYYYVDFEAKGNNFTHFKVDNKSLGEMRLASFSYNTISNAMEYKYSISEGELDENTLSFVNEIKGDTRHDGKTFMLAVEYTGVVNISTNVSITVTYNGGSDTIKPLLSEREGKVVAYYNLSQILKDKNVTTINITLNNDSHSVEKVRLLEATSASKPAVSEERVVYPKN